MRIRETGRGLKYDCETITPSTFAVQRLCFRSWRSIIEEPCARTDRPRGYSQIILQVAPSQSTRALSKRIVNGHDLQHLLAAGRSEERRVGTECSRRALRLS